MQDETTTRFKHLVIKSIVHLSQLEVFNNNYALKQNILQF